MQQDLVILLGEILADKKARIQERKAKTAVALEASFPRLWPLMQGHYTIDIPMQAFGSSDPKVRITLPDCDEFTLTLRAAWVLDDIYVLTPELAERGLLQYLAIKRFPE